MTLAGKDLQNVGTEPKTQATIYNVTAPDAFSADITGIGSLRPPPMDPRRTPAMRRNQCEASAADLSPSWLGCWRLRFPFCAVGLIFSVSQFAGSLAVR